MKGWIGCMLLAMSLVACAPSSPALRSPNLPPPSALQVVHALDSWPAEFKRPFFATIRLGDHRITAQGVIDLHPAGESRLTVVSESGEVLVDATIKANEARILRSAPGIGQDVLKEIAADSVLALGRPEPFDVLHVLWHETYATAGFFDRDRFKFVGPDGRLQSAHLFRGPWDSLRVQVLRYTPEGEPLEVIFYRPRYWYMVSLTFTDKK